MTGEAKSAKRNAERCPICGQPVDIGDADALQVHCGIGGVADERCLVEHDDEGEYGRKQGDKR